MVDRPALDVYALSSKYRICIELVKTVKTHTNLETCVMLIIMTILLCHNIAYIELLRKMTILEEIVSAEFK